MKRKLNTKLARSAGSTTTDRKEKYYTVKLGVCEFYRGCSYSKLLPACEMAESEAGRDLRWVAAGIE